MPHQPATRSSLRHGAQLSARYKQQGNLTVGYYKCGPQAPRSEALLHRASLWLKRLHPDWGAPLIHLRLLERYDPQRTLQRWLPSARANKAGGFPAVGDQPSSLQSRRLRATKGFGLNYSNIQFSPRLSQTEFPVCY